jgi:putative transposase
LEEKLLETIQQTGEKKGTKRSVLVDSEGIPLSVVVSGANTHDVKLLGETLDAIIVERPEETEEQVQNLCLDAGYTGHADDVTRRGYIPHIRPRGEEKKEIENNPNFKARRWVVEVAHSWVNRFRKLLVRFEKKACNYVALVQFAFAIIAWRKLINVHKHTIVG